MARQLRKRWARECRRAAGAVSSCGERCRVKGQIYGNQLKGSVAHVTNGRAFHIRYNEMSTGYPNDAIDSNEFGPNPNARCSSG